MIAFSPIEMIVIVILYALFGMAVGAVVGWACTLATKLSRRFWVDAALGAFGLLGGGLGAIEMPWHRNTIYYQLSGGMQVESTADIYQHPERVALLFAVLLPILFEFYRFARSRSASNRMNYAESDAISSRDQT